MDYRFSRRLLGVAIALSLSTSLLASTPAFPSEEPTRGDDLAMAPPSQRRADKQLTAAVILPPSVQNIQPKSEALDNSLRKSGEDEATLRNGLVHASKGMQALTAGDRVRAQEELEISMGMLSKIPEGATSSGLRLQLIEETALLKAALSGTPPGQVVDSQANEQKEAREEEEDEDETDTEAAPDLVVPDEESKLAPPDGEVVSTFELDLNSFDVPIVLNEQVKDYLRYYQTRKWGVMSRAFERSGRYLPMMRSIFRAQGLPQDLVNLAYVESAFNYRAYSRARAAGIWQFIKSTGSRYGMRVNHWLDERRDPEKATRAAAAYLKELYEMFQSWPLALAAYNAGEYRILEAIEAQGTTDFWSLRLPKETRLFVPAFMAVTIIAKDPGRYGFATPVEEPWKAERVTVPGAIELRSIARAVGVSPDVIRDLNPALLRGMTPATFTEYEISLPLGAKEVLLANLDQLPRSPSRMVARAAGRWHRVRRGETLRLIASRHQMTVAGLAGLNGVKVGDRLKVGTLLRLVPAQPSNERTTTVAQSTRSWTGVTRVPEAAPAVRSTVHVVKRGETLWGIAKAYAVTPEELRRWNDNDLKGQAKLRPGQTLRLRSGQPLKMAAQTGRSNRETRRAATASTVPALYHRVKQGDTLWGIARDHDVTPEELRRWNDLGHQAKLRVGQELLIRLSES